MKRAEHFERKRKARDKANKRWIKARPLMFPAILLAGGLGLVIGGTLGLALWHEYAAAGMIVGMAIGVWISGFFILNRTPK